MDVSLFFLLYLLYRYIFNHLIPNGHIILGRCEQLAINWSDVSSASASPALPSLHPAVVPLAPCTCDLAPALCDLDCCCDEVSIMFIILF